MTITPTDEDIAEALREHGYGYIKSPQEIALYRRSGSLSIGEFSHAQTIAKLRVAVEALEVISYNTDPYDSTGWFHRMAGAALTQIKGTDHD